MEDSIRIVLDKLPEEKRRQWLEYEKERESLLSEMLGNEEISPAVLENYQKRLLDLENLSGEILNLPPIGPEPLRRSGLSIKIAAIFALAGLTLLIAVLVLWLP